MDRLYILGRQQLSVMQSLTSPSRGARSVHRAFAEAYGKLLTAGISPSRSAATACLPMLVSVLGNNEKVPGKLLSDKGAPPSSAPGPAPVQTADCVTSGRVALHMRAADISDQVAVIALLSAINHEDFRFRFGATVKEVGPSLVAPLLQLDRTVGVTFLASTADGMVIAASTLADIRGTDAAEVALSVHASWKGKGVAWALLEHTLAYATARGLKEVTAFESGEDRLAVNLEREMGFVARLVSASPVELSLTKNVSAE